MDIPRTLKSLKLLVNRIEQSAPVERLYIYSSTKRIFKEIISYSGDPDNAEDFPSCANTNAKNHIAVMNYHLKSLCGIDANGLGDSSNIQCALTEIDKLRSSSCFDIGTDD